MRLARLFAGAAVGAGLMYLLDPEGGRRRRALLRDQLVSAAHKTTDAVDATSRDMTNRARGVVAELRGRFSRNDHVSDDVLRERVRARIGSVVGHGGGIETHVQDVVNQLDVHETPGTIPALQGRPLPARAGEVFDLLPTRWPPSASLVGMGALIAVAGLAAGRRQLGW